MLSIVMLIVAGVGSLILSTPLALLAIRRHARIGQALHRTALLASAVNGLVQGLALGGLGFLFAAGIGDENAGEIVVLLAGGGLVAGAVLAFPLSYLLILVGCRVYPRRAS